MTTTTPPSTTPSPGSSRSRATWTESPAPDERSAAAARQRALGAYGESVATRYLLEQGMVLLDRNWRCPHGEIDLVLRDGQVLVICEVKTRSSDAYGTPHEGVSAAKWRRLRRLAAAWMQAHEVHPRNVRIDMVAITRPRRGPSIVEHVAGLS